MATITDQTYFVRERLVPPTLGEVGLPTEASTVENAILTDFINIYEPIFLKLILGDTLYAEYLAGRTTEGNKWKTFDAYMFNSTTKESCVADYIFFYYWRDKNTTVGDGTHLVNGEAKTRVSPDVRTIPVWNRMVMDVRKALIYLMDNYSTYFETETPNYEGWANFVHDNFNPKMINSLGI